MASPSSRLSLQKKLGVIKRLRNGTALVTRGCCGQDVAGTDERRITRGLHPSDDSECNCSVMEKNPTEPRSSWKTHWLDSCHTAATFLYLNLASKFHIQMEMLLFFFSHLQGPNDMKKKFCVRMMILVPAEGGREGWEGILKSLPPLFLPDYGNFPQWAAAWKKRAQTKHVRGWLVSQRARQPEDR